MEKSIKQVGKVVLHFENQIKQVSASLPVFEKDMANKLRNVNFLLQEHKSFIQKIHNNIA